MDDRRSTPEPLAQSVGAHLRKVEMYYVAGEPPGRQIRPGVEWCDHGIDLDLDGTVIGIMWVIRDAVLSLEAASTPVADSLFGDPPLHYQRVPIGRESMWSPLIGQRLTAAGWSARLDCALDLWFGDAVVTIAAANWKEHPPPIRQCSDAILVLFGEDWHGDVDR